MVPDARVPACDRHVPSTRSQIRAVTGHKGAGRPGKEAATTQPRPSVRPAPTWGEGRKGLEGGALCRQSCNVPGWRVGRPCPCRPMGSQGHGTGRSWGSLGRRRKARWPLPPRPIPSTRWLCGLSPSPPGRLRASVSPAVTRALSCGCRSPGWLSRHQGAESTDRATGPGGRRGPCPPSKGTRICQASVGSVVAAGTKHHQRAAPSVLEPGSEVRPLLLTVTLLCPQWEKGEGSPWVPL